MKTAWLVMPGGFEDFAVARLDVVYVGGKFFSELVFDSWFTLSLEESEVPGKKRLKIVKGHYPALELGHDEALHEFEAHTQASDINAGGFENPGTLLRRIQSELLARVFAHREGNGPLRRSDAQKAHDWEQEKEDEETGDGFGVPSEKASFQDSHGDLLERGC